METSNDPKEFAESMLRIIQKELPTIAKYNQHLYQNILSAIELTIDGNMPPHMCEAHYSKHPVMNEETKEKVDKLIAELNL